MRKTYERLGAVALGASLLAATVPAEAGFRFRSGPAGFGFGHSSVGGALGAGLLGGLALGLLANAQRQPTSLAYNPAPQAYLGPDDEVVEEVWRESPPLRTGPARRNLRHAPSRVESPTAPVRSPRPSAAVDACSSAIVKASKAYGETRVSAAGAGPVVRDQRGRSVSVDARIEYRRGDRTEVRSARVNCRLGPDGHVVAIR